jgi:hypothetical protein
VVRCWPCDQARRSQRRPTVDRSSDIAHRIVPARWSAEQHTESMILVRLCFSCVGRR